MRTVRKVVLQFNECLRSCVKRILKLADYVVGWIETATELDCANCLLTGLINRSLSQILLLIPFRL